MPLLQFTSDRRRMGPFTSGPWLRAAGWVTAVVVLALDLWQVSQTITDWANGAGPWAPAIWTLSLAICAGLLTLLLWITLHQYRRPAAVPATLGLEERSEEQKWGGLVTAQTYRRILVPLDHSELDRIALGHAAGLAARGSGKQGRGRIYLLHVEEGVTSQVYGSESSTAEVEAGREYLDSLVASLSQMDIDVETAIRHGANPRKEIVRYAKEIEPDLLVMGAHGHGGIKDLIFGNTINPVRHELDIPILVVRS
jgi:manganese transport protein